MSQNTDEIDRLENPLGAPSFNVDWECPELSVPEPSVTAMFSLEHVEHLREPLNTFMELQLAFRLIRFIKVEAKDFPIELSVTRTFAHSSGLDVPRLNRTSTLCISLNCRWR